MRILLVASEVTPFSQSGGLAEVVGSLPSALAEVDGDVEVAVVTPLYRGARERIEAAGLTLRDTGFDVAVAFPAADAVCRVRVVKVSARVVQVFLDCPPLFDREGLYGDASGDFSDNWLRFAVLSRAALSVWPAIWPHPPDVIHGHDWQAAMAAVFVRKLGWTVPTVVTVHNLAFQGAFPKRIMEDLGLGWQLFRPRAMESFDRASFLKGGLAMADAVTTVSPTGAREIYTPEVGAGLDAFLVHDVVPVVGIVNGIDTVKWDPRTGDGIASKYGPGDHAGKALCRRDLVSAHGLEVDERDLLLGMVTRMTDQKGVDLLAELIGELDDLGARLIVLGSGEAHYERELTELATQHRGSFALTVGFDESLARRIFAGADCLLMPSRFEPCGLSQLYAMRYGTVPIVNPVGGLRDTVTDPGDEGLVAGAGSGVWMKECNHSALRAAVRRVARLRRRDPRGWTALVEACLGHDASWRASAIRYLELYRRCGERPRGPSAALSQ